MIEKIRKLTDPARVAKDMGITSQEVRRAYYGGSKKRMRKIDEVMIPKVEELLNDLDSTPTN